MRNNAPIAALIAAVTAYSVALGATYTALAISLSEAGYSTFLVALNAAMTPLGLVLSSLVLPRIIRGKPFWWLVLGAVSSAALLSGLALATASFAWVLALRFLLGCSTNVLFIVGETALMMIITPARRGRILAAYNAIITVGYALGPALLILTGNPAATLAAAAGFTLLAMLPVTIARTSISIDLPGDESPGGALRYLLIVPALALAAGGTALFDNATLSLLPIAKMMTGMARDPALALVTITMIGAVVLQLPIGAIVDSYNKTLALIVLCSLTGLGCAGLFALPEPFALQATYLFILGGLAFGVYSATLALIADNFDGQDLIGANALLALCWGLGSLIGVPAVGLAIDLIGPGGFGWTTAVPFIVAALLAARWARHGIRRA